MKKKLSILLSMVLIFSMLLALTGCGGGDKAKLIGTWKCEVDMTQQLNDEFAADESTAGLLTVREFKLVVYLEFKEDDTYSMKVDEASLDTAMDGLVNDITDGVAAYMEQLMKAELGVEMSIDEILTLANTTMEDLVNEMFPEAVLEDMKTEIVSSVNQEGKFKAEGGKLYTSAGLEYNVDPAVYETYTLNGDTLTILEYVGDDPEIVDSIYPMVFNKIN